MIDAEDNAINELKRADHLFFVTLKYTRTGDVIKNTIHRLINAFEFSMVDLLTKKKVKDIPSTPLAQAELLEKLFSKKKEIKDYIDFYYHLKKIDRADYTAKEEYRKNVTLLTGVENVNVERLYEFYQKTKEFVHFIQDFK